MSPEVTILIVNWRSKQYVEQCLRSVQNSCSHLKIQVIVVDGASFDGCDTMLAAHFPTAEYVQSHENIGFGQCNNLGAQLVRAPLLMLLNPDTEIKGRAIDQLISTLRSDPSIGIVGPRLLNTDLSIQTSCVQPLPTPINQAIDSELVQRLIPKWARWENGASVPNGQPSAVQAVSGACMLMPTDLFVELGGFRPEFFMYAEDMDLCIRVARRRRRIMHEPRAEIVHHGGGSSSHQPSEFATTQMRRALETYMRLNHGPYSARAYRTLMSASALIRISMLLPAALIARPRKRHLIANSIKKWTYVLRWALGAPMFHSRSSLGTPQNQPLRSNAGS